MTEITEIISRKSPGLSAEVPLASLGQTFEGDEAATLVSLVVGETKAYNNYGALDGSLVN